MFPRHLSPAPPQGARFATIPAACAWSGLGRTRVYELAREGEITIRKAGRRSLVDLDSLARFLESRPRLGE